MSQVAITRLNRFITLVRFTESTIFNRLANYLVFASLDSTVLNNKGLDLGSNDTVKHFIFVVFNRLTPKILSSSVSATQ